MAGPAERGPEVSAVRRPVPNSTKRRKLKAALAERDGMACFYCRTPFTSAEEGTLDHLVPYSRVPGWSQANLVLACRACNDAKADRLPQEFLRAAGLGPGLVPLSGVDALFPPAGADVCVREADTTASMADTGVRSLSLAGAS